MQCDICTLPLAECGHDKIPALRGIIFRTLWPWICEKLDRDEGLGNHTVLEAAEKIEKAIEVDGVFILNYQDITQAIEDRHKRYLQSIENKT